MIFWLRLKLDLLPCIAQEIDKVSAEYLRLIENLKRGDKSALHNILIMQAAIKARIEELDAFYEKNYTDYRIAYFEKLKIKLRKLLYTSIETGIKTPEPALNSNINDPFRNEANDQFSRSSKRNDVQSSEEEKLATAGSYGYGSQSQNRSQQQAASNGRGVSPVRSDKFGSAATKEVPKRPVSSTAQRTNGRTAIAKPSTASGKNRSPLPTKTKEVTQVRSSAAKPEDKSRRTTESGKKADEIVFTIKMTKEEYMQFLQTKAAKGK